MTYVLNNLVTTAAYSDARTLPCPNAVRINLDVAGASIFYELGFGWPVQQWRDEIALQPGFRSLDQRADAVRVRSQGPAQATVTIAAYPPDEIPGGDDG